VFSEAINERQYILRQLQTQLSAVFALGRTTPKHLVSRRLTPLPHCRWQRGIFFIVVTLKLDNEPVNTRRQQPRTTEPGHIAEQVRRVQPLHVHFQLQFFNQDACHLCEHFLG